MEFRIIQIKNKMKITLSLVFILSITLHSTSMTQVNSDYSFRDYVRQFNKEYSNEEYAKRQVIFNANFERIKEKMQDKSINYKVQVNKFIDWSEEEKSSYSTYRPAGLKQTFTPKPPLRLKGAQLPPIDYRTLGMVTEVKDQGTCGSCWTFSTAALYQSLFLIHQQASYDLAEQYILQCSGGGSCSGGIPLDALQAFTKTGIPLQQSYNYTGSFTTPNKCSNSNSTYKKLTKPIKSIDHYHSLTDAELQQLLTDNGPLAVAVAAGSSAFMDYSSGIFSGCLAGAQVDHAVLLVGFTAQGHWIIKNSWGTDWGNQGYITIHKSYDCGLKTYVDVVVVQNSPNIAPSNSSNTTSSNSTNTSNATTTNTTNTTTNLVNYTVTLTDSFGDGWNGNVLGVQQSGRIAAIFGSKFVTGSTYGPVLLTVNKGVLASVVVYIYGNYTNEIGFKIYDDKGTLVFTRNPAIFGPSIIFTTFCPYCSAPTNASIYITLTDSFGDGWNGNQIAVKRDPIQFPFGKDFATGHQYPYTMKITLNTSVVYSIVPYVMGLYREQVGFIIRNQYGAKLFQRVPGVSYAATDILGTICLLCANNLQVMYATLSEDQRVQYATKQQLIASQSSQTKHNIQENTLKQKEQLPGSTLSVIVVLSVVLFILLILWTVTMIALYKIWKKAKNYQQTEGDNTNSIHFTLNQNKSTVMKTEIDKTIKQDAN